QVSETTNKVITEDDCTEQIEQTNNEDKYVNFDESEYEDFKEYMKHYIPTQMEPSTLLTYGENNEPIITIFPSRQTNEQVEATVPKHTLKPEQEELLLQEEENINKIKKDASCLPVIELGIDLP